MKEKELNSSVLAEAESQIVEILPGGSIFEEGSMRSISMLHQSFISQLYNLRKKTVWNRCIRRPGEIREIKTGIADMKVT